MRLSGFARLALLAVMLAPMVVRAGFIDQRGEELRRQGDVQYRVDTGSESIESVIANDQGWMLQAVHAWYPDGGPVRLWARFEMLPQAATRRVFITTGPWERVEYFAVRDRRIVGRDVAGTFVPASQRKTHVGMVPVFVLSGFTAFDVPANTPTTIYARLSTDNRLVEMGGLRFSVWGEDSVRDEEERDRMFQSAFLGIMLMLAAYNLSMYFIEGFDRSYLFYVLSMAGLEVTWLAGSGLGAELLWPEYPMWDHFAAWISIPVVVYSFGQFVRIFLDLRAHLPRLDTQLNWFLRFCLVALPLCVVVSHLWRPGAEVFGVLFAALPTAAAIIVCGATVMAMRAGIPSARLFSIAIACSAAGSIVSLFAATRSLPLPRGAVDAQQIGFALTGLLLSIGLGFRMRDLRSQLQKREVEDKLLANILPRAVIDELAATGTSEPRRHDEVSILFTDFAGFTQTVATLPAKRLVQELDEIFRGFDDIVEAHGLEKIKTIGDAYMAACGLPVAADDHAIRCARAALDLVRYIEKRNETASMKWSLRIGVHSGSVAAGIVGKHKYAYDVWGDTVNLASRLESSGEVGRVNISAYTRDLIQGRFECEYRGKLSAKGKGDIDMYFVVRERD